MGHNRQNNPDTPSVAGFLLPVKRNLTSQPAYSPWPDPQS
jgi:hypothetical protein